jgi:predicted transcriptional regulator
MRRDNRTYEARVAALDASIMRGLTDAEAGRLTPAAAVFDRLEVKYGALQAATTTAPRSSSPQRS